MYYTRRKFVGISIKSAILLSAGNLLQSYDIIASGLPESKKLKLRFAVCSDGHYGQPATDFENYHRQMVEWINAEKAGRGLDFCFINGDLYHNDTSVVPALKAQWDALKMPYYVSHGNHDHSKEVDWENTWGYPWHFGFEQKEAAFVVLNTADETGKYVSPDLLSTKSLLKDYASYKQLFVFMHITPFNWTDNGNPCPEIVALFNQQKNLKAIFHGHDHDQDAYKEHEGKYYFFDSHIAGSWGTAYRGYRVVEVLTNGDILTYQINPATKEEINSTRIM